MSNASGEKSLVTIFKSVLKRKAATQPAQPVTVQAVAGQGFEANRMKASAAEKAAGADTPEKVFEAVQVLNNALASNDLVLDQKIGTAQKFVAAKKGTAKQCREHIDSLGEGLSAMQGNYSALHALYAQIGQEQWDFKDPSIVKSRAALKDVMPYHKDRVYVLGQQIATLSDQLDVLADQKAAGVSED